VTDNPDDARRGRRGELEERRARAHRGDRARRRVGLAMTLAVGAVSRAAGAEPERAPVYVEWRGCEASSSSDVAAILRVELLNRVVDSSGRADAYRTTVECTGDQVAIAVGAQAGGATKALQANLARTPANVRARIVALAIAELVRDLDRDLHGPPPVAPAPMASPPTPPPPLPSEPAPARARDHVVSPAAAEPLLRSVNVGAFAAASTLRLDGVWLGGGGAEIEVVQPHWCAGLDATFLTSTQRFDPGTAQALLGYGSPYVAWRGAWPYAELRLGAGYALGAASISGHPTDPRAFGATTTGPWTAPYGFGALAFVLARRVSVDVRAEAGWVTSPVTGNVAGGADLALEGFWMGLHAGATIRL
jgi:hypothetical protein